MKSKSLALKTDSHLGNLLDRIEIKEETLKVNDYAYVDYEVVGGGAIFFFAPFDKWFDDSWKESEMKEIFVEFEEQRLYREEYDYVRGIILGEKYKMIDNGHEAFNLDEALEDAELKAIATILGLE
ncbi:hypothetical protein [Sphingobacterium sp. 1.A.4]|uniref:hypothetical protein n=1 Tax=Sphingobacterium sp. 1.A.4 TaxID=2044603 RepID=UPI001181B8F2|nr:hypothetical protein [Sphingobacterium sp. 1.A.4]